MSERERDSKRKEEVRAKEKKRKRKKKRRKKERKREEKNEKKLCRLKKVTFCNSGPSPRYSLRGAPPAKKNVFFNLGLFFYKI